MKKIEGTKKTVVVEEGAQYIADDGSVFYSEEDCVRYETLRKKTMAFDKAYNKIHYIYDHKKRAVIDDNYLVPIKFKSKDDFLQLCRDLTFRYGQNIFVGTHDITDMFEDFVLSMKFPTTLWLKIDIEPGFEDEDDAINTYTFFYPSYVLEMLNNFIKLVSTTENCDTDLANWSDE